MLVITFAVHAMWVVNVIYKSLWEGKKMERGREGEIKKKKKDKLICLIPPEKAKLSSF